MKLTQEQIEFLDVIFHVRKVWTLNSEGKIDVDGDVYITGINTLTEIPIKFGMVDGNFYCHDNPNLTTLKNFPDEVNGGIVLLSNNLTDYFKTLKKEDFRFWDRIEWGLLLNDYPFLINIGEKYLDKYTLDRIVTTYPLTKLYLKD
jgi:hypothetical protein